MAAVDAWHNVNEITKAVRTLAMQADTAPTICDTSKSEVISSRLQPTDRPTNERMKRHPIIK